MDSIAAPTRPEQQNPPNSAGIGPPRTYVFEDDPARGFVSVRVTVGCGRDGATRTHLVADVVEPRSADPGLRLFGVLGVNAVMEICRMVQERKHLPAGPGAAAGG